MPTACAGHDDPFEKNTHGKSSVGSYRLGRRLVKENGFLCAQARSRETGREEEGNGMSLGPCRSFMENPLAGKSVGQIG